MKDTNKKLMTGALAGAMLLSFAGCNSTSGKITKAEKLADDPKAEAAFDYDAVRKTSYDEDVYSSDYNKYAFNIMSVTASNEHRSCSRWICARQEQTAIPWNRSTACLPNPEILWSNRLLHQR